MEDENPIIDFFKEHGADIAGAGLGALGIDLAQTALDEVGDVGENVAKTLAGAQIDPLTGLRTGGLASAIDERLEFQPYTVTTATGSDFGMMQMPERIIPAGTTFPDGSVSTEDVTIPSQMDYRLGLSDDEKTFYEQRLEDAGGMFDRAGKSTVSVEQDDETIVEVPREQQVFDRMMAAMAPQRERDRLALEQRLQNQGRLGVRTGMFGGTPEQLALAQAQAEAENQAILNAMRFAREEQESQARLGAGMLAAGYVPQAQLLGASQPGMTAAERRRQAISQQTGAYGETYASGIQGLLQSALAQANIAGGVGGSIAKAALGGLFGN